MYNSILLTEMHAVSVFIKNDEILFSHLSQEKNSMEFPVHYRRTHIDSLHARILYVFITQRQNNYATCRNHLFDSLPSCDPGDDVFLFALLRVPMEIYFYSITLFHSHQ